MHAEIKFFYKEKYTRKCNSYYTCITCLFVTFAHTIKYFITNILR